MSRLLMLILSLVFLLTGCVKPGKVKLGGCPVISAPAECTNPDVETEPKIVVTINGPRSGKSDSKVGDTVTVVPANLCVLPGTTIEVDIMGEDKNGDGIPDKEPPGTAILPKKFKNIWLVASNVQDNRKIHITVPKEAQPGDYDYSIVTSTGDCIDPRLHVRN